MERKHVWARRREEICHNRYIASLDDVRGMLPMFAKPHCAPDGPGLELHPGPTVDAQPPPKLLIYGEHVNMSRSIRSGKALRHFFPLLRQIPDKLLLGVGSGWEGGVLEDPEPPPPHIWDGAVLVGLWLEAGQSHVHSIGCVGSASRSSRIRPTSVILALKDCQILGCSGDVSVRSGFSVM